MVRQIVAACQAESGTPFAWERPPDSTVEDPPVTRLLILPLAVALVAGCENASSTPTAGTTTKTTTTTTTKTEEKPDVHVRTPRVDVDVQRTGHERKVDVDVNKKDR